MEKDIWAEKMKKRKNKMQKELGCKFIRINPDHEKFNISFGIGKILRSISEKTTLPTNQPTKY